MRHETIATCGCLALLLAGCAGNGAGLDENGRPAGEPNGPLVAEFSSIQDHVFTPFCTTCHAGAAAPLGLRLTEGDAYAALVNASSVEVSSLRRVAPGNPGASYLVQKISGTAAVGGRMPLGGPPLPAEMIAAIQQWITNGAQAPAAQTVLPGSPAELSAVFPMAQSTLALHAQLLGDATPGAVVVSASHELNASTLDATTVSLQRSDGDGTFTDGNEVDLANPQIDVRSMAPTILAVTPREPWVADRYRLVIAGSGAAPVRDLFGTAVDGDGDGTPGGDFIVEFDVVDSGEVTR